MRSFRSFSLVVCLVAVGCSGETPSLGWQDDVGASQRALTVDHEAVLTFQADWNNVTSSPPIMAGGKLRIDYAPERLPNCRAMYNGMNTWSIVPYYRALPDTAVKQAVFASAGGWQRATIELPEATTAIELWFVNTDRAGCREVDSNYAKNYRFDVAKPGRLTPVHFTADWKQTADGAIEQGGLLRIDYAPERLRACRGTKNGGRVWNIFASWAFRPSNQTGSVALYDGNYFAGEEGILKPDVYVPEGTTSVELWFSNSDYYGCAAWDSNFGKNYSFPVVPRSGTAPVGWAGDFNFVMFHRDPQQNLGDVDPAYYFDDWGGAELASWVEVQVWIQGITDRSYASVADARAAANAAIKAEAVTDAISGTVGGWGTMPLAFRRQQGNNFVFSFDFNSLHWQTGANIPDGLYHYYTRFSTDAGKTWYEAGKAPKTRRFVVAKQSGATSCKWFPDHAPSGCPQDRPVGWAGNWGGRFTHACDLVAGIPDPVVFTKSSLGHDCMTITAEVWIDGLTTAGKGGDPASVRAEVETDIGFSGGPLATLATYPLVFDGQAGNNFRFAWNANENVGRADSGDYKFRFRFSGDGGKTWFYIGKAAGPTGGDFRKLLVRNDSSQIPMVQHCDNVSTWSGPTQVVAACMNYDVKDNYDATNCEFFVNALGKGSLSHNGTAASWLEAYVRILGTQLGQVLNVGMLTHTKGSPLGEIWSLGTQIDPGYWMTGITTARSGPGVATPFSLDVVDFAFFVDVRRADGTVARLWQSGGGQNYTVAGAFPASGYPPYSKNIGVGSIDYANDGVTLFKTKHSCGY